MPRRDCDTCINLLPVNLNGVRKCRFSGGRMSIYEWEIARHGNLSDCPSDCPEYQNPKYMVN